MHADYNEIEFDPSKAQSNLVKHKVSFAHAEQALRDDEAITIEDRSAQGEQRFVTLGMDALGRVLVVVHTPRGDKVRLISARKASRGEAEQYHA
ncbi:BrnT family toxin [Duganella sp. LX20W]|uniref:BrnT family toxin n=1 Tax=Rugamonas brunnea TaxID=2758569 RepID=A0A7W2EW40_9BURK|nr:BrnT family toxin [Rugamonas brunnea]MBA5639697.1 BrnT family toxin [Rugamonas brunnea]